MADYTQLNQPNTHLTKGGHLFHEHAFRLFSIELHLVFSPKPTLDTPRHLGQAKTGISDLLSMLQTLYILSLGNKLYFASDLKWF